MFGAAASAGRRHLEQFDGEQQGGIGRQLVAAHPALAVAELRGDDELEGFALAHQGDAFGPAADDAIERELGRLAALVGAVELAPVDERPAIVDLDRVRGGRLAAGGIGAADAAVLQAAVGGGPAAPGAVDAQILAVAGGPALGGAGSERDRGRGLRCGGAGGEGEDGGERGEVLHTATLAAWRPGATARRREVFRPPPLFRRQSEYISAFR